MIRFNRAVRQRGSLGSHLGSLDLRWDRSAGIDLRRQQKRVEARGAPRFESNQFDRFDAHRLEWLPQRSVRVEVRPQGKHDEVE
jgi:hypothetical protein